jgi:NAD(P)-dependent dehydrogenase (short-subunit alcohol dehydrogenase family)
MTNQPLPKTPSLRLDGQRSLVTGAGRGLGLAAGTALAEAGAHVTLCARTSSEIEQVAHELQVAGFSSDTLALDVRNIDAFRAAIEEREPYHILINNAGTNRPNTFINVTVEHFDLVMDLNVRAAYFVAQTIARRMVTAGIRGSIVNMSSQMGHVGGANRSLYCASKWAMEGFSKSMAIDLGPHGIRVNTLCPTFIETPMTNPFFESVDFKADVLAKIKLGRLGTLQDVMGPIVFLASEASSLMTGSSLVIDGGWTAD